MFRLVLLALALALAFIILQQLPDIRRYMRIRSM
jgi:hypothetical protein